MSAQHLDRTLDHTETSMLGGPHRLKLAVFGANCSGGCSITTADGPPVITWDESKEIAMATERAGIEALIPIARWRGFGGPSNFQARSFDTFAWAAALSAVTTKLQVFSTFHVPTVHPVRVAKEVATIDHISGGRFGLNLTAGWNAPELSMFGLTQREHDDRYVYADEFVEVLMKLCTEEEEFDFEGEFFTIKGGISEPKPIQKPFPVCMSAGGSPAGREFAAKYADISFIITDDLERAKTMVADVKQNARDKYGKEILVFAQSHITCAPTEEEAKKRHSYFMEAHGDREAANNLVDMLMPNTDAGQFEREKLITRIMAGWGATPLTGTPEQVVQGMQELADTGLDGITLSWFDYLEGLEQFRADLLPLMIEAGLRAEA